MFTLLLAGFIEFLGFPLTTGIKPIVPQRTESKAILKIAFDHAYELMVATPWNFYRKRPNRPITNVGVKAGRID